MGQAFTIRFENGQQARAARVSEYAPPHEVIALLGLPRVPAVITVGAGAAGTSSKIVNELQAVFNNELAPLASKFGIAILDGGTASGVVGMMGAARSATNGTFPLIGVAPLKQISYPGHTGADPYGVLDPNHTHFALIDADAWGTESGLLVRLGKQLAARRVVLIINGGEIVRREVLMHANAGNNLLVMAGSGRVSDQIVQAIADGHSSDPLINSLLKTGRARICNPQNLIQMLIDTLDLNHAH